MKGKNSFRYNGLVNRKTVGVELTNDRKGLVLTTRNQSGKIRWAFKIDKYHSFVLLVEETPWLSELNSI